MKTESNLYSRYFTYIKPIAKLPIVKNYGSTIFTIIAATIFIFFAIKPTIETILVLQKKISDANLVLEKATQKVNNLSLGKKNYDNLDPNIKEQIGATIPDTVGLKSLIQNLEGSALSHQASISALQIQPVTISTKTEPKMGTLSEVSFTFNIEGAYNNLSLVLEDLKKSTRILSIESLSLSTANEGGLIMSLSGKTYYLK